MFCSLAFVSTSASSAVKSCDEDVGYAVVDDNGSATCFVTEVAYVPFGYEPCADIQMPFVYSAIEPEVIPWKVLFKPEPERIRWDLINTTMLSKDRKRHNTLVYFDDHPKG